ncbi:MAG: hypothetical protein JKX94_03275 [Sneathiella sp.]|nr:hypothetical protein [Sneathiella sp.]
MFDEEFTKIVKEAINYNELNRYFLPTDEKFEAIDSHFELQPNISAIESDKASSGGLKLSHAQRRMLILLVALWEGNEADRIFSEGIGSISKMIHSMDRDNRELFADLILTYPGWGQ